MVCGVVSMEGINFDGCGLLLVVASDGYLAVDWDLAVILKFSVIKFVNTRKYFPFLKITFSENFYFPENILREPNTT